MNKYRQTLIGQIPKDWKVVKLGEIAEYIKGKKPEEMTEEFKEGYLPYLSTEYLRVNGKTKFAKISKNTILADKSDLILLWDGSNAGEFFVGKKGVLSSTMVKIQLKGNADKKFLFHLLKTKENFLSGQTRGTGIPHVDKKVFENLRIPLPPLLEQQKIAKILSTVDEAIQKVDEVIAKTERLKKGLMQELLIKGTGHKEFKYSKELGCEIPKEWEAGKIVEFSKTRDKPVQTGPFGAQLHASDYTEVGVPLILIKNVIDGRIIEDGMPKISEEKAKELERYRLKVGDIVFSRVGSIGRVVVIKNYQKGWLISGQMLRVRLENPEINNDFLAYFIETAWFKRALKSRTVGATRKSINETILSNLPLIKPPISEQQKIAEILSTVDKKLELERKRKEKFERIKKGLMNELFSGKKRVKIVR